MPAATPLPRHPGALTLEGAEGLLNAPGCPVCRYADEASERYLTWFALEGHSDATTITRFARSMGTCARHTRRLMSQPGAAERLTAVFPYILKEARGRLAGKAVPLPRCPVCEHDRAAASRAMDTLLEGFADSAVRDRCAALGGLCVPHLGDAAATGHRKTTVQLIQTMAEILNNHAASSHWIAGDADDDADIRAVLRKAMPASAQPGSYVCTACLAAARAEPGCIARVVAISHEGLPEDPDLLLCASHLADAVRQTSDASTVPWLLAWQANAHVGLRSAGPLPSLRAGTRKIASFLRTGPYAGATQCAACQAHSAAAQHALDEYSQTLRTHPKAQHQPCTLCARHVLSLRIADPRAAKVITRNTIEVADLLLAELAAAFGNRASGRRDVFAGVESTAWRRAAAFLDGDVFCGSPPYLRQVPQPGRRIGDD